MASSLRIQKFQKLIWDYYTHNRRSFPWRETRDPYKILVSEIMLQQTQAPRVVDKYESFIKRFPTIKSLAQASTATVLKEWQGLGYNRRGLNLKKCAIEILSKHNGKLPRNYEALLELPGIGPATAGDIVAFAWNIPKVIIETNIRTVFLHYFFKDESNISDSQLLPLIEAALDPKKPRDWYYALMDYGAMLKKSLPNPSRRSKHYTKQSVFKGSNRELRSLILKYILAYPRQSAETIIEALGMNTEAIIKNLEAMTKEGLISQITLKKTTVFIVQ